MRSALPQKFQSSAVTDVGQLRDENQDACALFSTESGALVAIVADGMGGHTGGATASRLAIATVHDLIASTHEEAEINEFVSAIDEANARVYQKALDEPELRGMGTTFVGILFHSDGRAWVAHVGDSRAYRLRAGVLEPLTRDHSLVAELIRSGAMTNEEAEGDPRRNEILRSIGVDASVEVEDSPISVHPGDCFLLCSDGLTGTVSEQEISSILDRYDPEDAAHTLIVRANENGGPDNITATVIHYPDPESITEVRSVIPDLSSIESDRLALARETKRLSRLRKILLATAIVGIALIASLLVLLISAQE